jgi:hypothetical protein
MATGYEVEYYRNIGQIRKALESIAASLEKIANPPVVVEPPADHEWVDNGHMYRSPT